MVNIVRESSLGGRRPFKKEKKNKKVQSSESQTQKFKFKTDQSQIECFYCKKQDHWKRNYPQNIASLDLNRPKNKEQLVVG